MSIITISRGSYSKGKEIAERLADRLGYECISRDILLEASEHFNIPEIKLIRALHDAPSIFNRITHGKEKYVMYIQEAILEHMQKDNIVYHGLAGHFFLRGIPHVMKVRITANIDDRIREEMARENISAEEARSVLLKDDEERRKWSKVLYGIDNRDSRLYDIILHIDTLQVDNAVNMLADIVKQPCFQTTPESRKLLEDYLVKARICSALIDKFPTAQVDNSNGWVDIMINAPLIQEMQIINQVNDILEKITDLKDIRIHIIPTNITMN